MRSQEERDQQTLDIAGGVFVFGLIVAAGAGVIWLTSTFAGGVSDLALLLVIVAGLVAAVAYVVRGRHQHGGRHHQED